VSAPKRLVVGISGASGAVYGIRLLEVLRDSGVETHLVMSAASRRVALLESGRTPQQIEALASFSYADNDLEAPVASGSFPVMGMVVAPCSIKSLSAIAHCFSETLLVRAADVALKERRRLVLVVRETPLHLGHLRLMTTVTEYGAVVLPPIPGFYHSPRDLDGLVDHTVGKILDQFELDHDLYRRWDGGDGGLRTS
jgi:4-hydroxy-3-polyprenylbenzoate decarboxylase